MTELEFDAYVANGGTPQAINIGVPGITPAFASTDTTGAKMLILYEVLAMEWQIKVKNFIFNVMGWGQPPE